MQFFNHHKTLIRKASLFGLITFALAVLLLIFIRFQEPIENVRLSYIRQVYLPAFAYRVHNAVPSELTRSFASIAGALMQEPQTNRLENNQERNSSIPVLVYHGIVEESSEGIDGINILVGDFYKHMTALKEAGYTAVTYEDFDRFVRGTITLPKKSVLITFDDGRKDSYYPVDPILKAYDFHATIFILPKYSLMSGKSEFYLSKRELQKMIASGRWSIQSHSMDAHTYYPIDANGTPSYYYANKLWLENEERSETNEEFKSRMLHDFTSSKTVLESALQIKVSGIAYPFGQYGQNTVNNPAAQEVVSELTQRAYDYAFYQVSPAAGFFYYSPKQGYMVRRIEPRSNWSAADLLAVLDAGKEKGVPFIDTFDTFTGWVKYYGEFSINKSMTLSTSRFNKETFVFLDGAQKWQNYVYAATVDQKQADALSLVVNMIDENNYQSCLFGNEYVRVTDRFDGKESTIVENETATAVSPAIYAVQQKQGSISCFINGVEVVSSSVRGTSGGTIGLKLFGDDADSHVEVESITINNPV